MSKELRSKIEAFPMDETGAALPFSARLARDQGWTPGYAQRVVREYLRFVYLAMEAGHPVTPSEEVDEAWHLHLCYTRSYWEDLCGGVLGRPLHHGPTRGGVEEDAKFHDWYGRTLESYRRIFGEEPPADIWPPVERRFAARARRGPGDDAYWRIEKAQVRKWSRWLGLGLGGLALAGCGTLLADSGGGNLCCFGIVLVFLTLLVVKGIVRGPSRGRRRRRGRFSRNDGGAGFGVMHSGCSSGGSDRHGDPSDSGCGSNGCGSSGCGSSGCGGGGCGGGGD